MWVKTFLLSLNKYRTISFLLLIILAIILFLIVLVFQQQREGKQRATTSSMSPTPSQMPLIYQGVYLHGYTTDLSVVNTFEYDARKKAAIIMFFQSWSSNFDFNKTFMDSIRNHGSIPLLSWTSTATDSTPNQPQYSLQNIINGNFDTSIAHFAQGAKAWGHPFFLRLDQEMNDEWAPWDETVNGNKPGQFVLMWRHVHDIFTRIGATNATWVWCPSAKGSLATLQELYPGNSYVDWTCMDGYNTGGKNWRSFSQIFGSTYQILLRITNKPILIAETASVETGGNKANWITDAFTKQLPNNFPNIKAFLWWDVDESATTGFDWRIESSPASQQAYAAARQSPVYASNQFAHLDRSPIAPLSAQT